MSGCTSDTVFEAGRLNKFSHEWEKITSDNNILDIVKHCHIEFDKIVPKQFDVYKPRFNETESKIIDTEIGKLLTLKVVKEVQFEDGQHVSPIFTRPKKNTSEHRMILNLKKLNESVAYHHFKMDTLETALKLIKPNCLMASIDLRHAYYSISIEKEQQKLLRFYWRDKLFQYTCLPNGIACAPRLFTKLMKPVYSLLRQYGHTNIGYIDDSLLISDSIEECHRNVTDTQELMKRLGFIIHTTKSVTNPCREIIFLGNVINSENMSVKLTEDRFLTLEQQCRHLVNKSICSIREMARTIGLMVASFSAVDFGQLHYRILEREKIAALQKNYGSFDATMNITSSMKNELEWWLINVRNQKRIIDRANPDITVITDASTEGWGAVYNENKIGGRWLLQEKANHINYLELLAIFLALQAFCKNDRQLHVKIMTDNTCALAYINNMGGIKSISLDNLARDIWGWCIERDIWLSCFHIPGVDNPADKSSRVFNEQVEWQLDRNVFGLIISKFGEPKIDLFASRINNQLPCYVSWKPDPGATHVNAFSFLWTESYGYAFPPFSLIGRVLQKIRQDEATVLMVVPIWTTQPWFSLLLQMTIATPAILPRKIRLLSLMNSDKIHPLAQKLQLMACRVSGKHSLIKDFQRTLPVSLWHHGVMEPKNNMLRLFKDGCAFVVKDRLISLIPL